MDNMFPEPDKFASHCVQSKINFLISFTKHVVGTQKNHVNKRILSTKTY